MNQTNHFFDLGYGWLCKHCSAEDADAGQQQSEQRTRFFSDSQAGGNEPRLSTPALARWTDASRQTLACPRCGIEEMVSKA